MDKPVRRPYEKKTATRAGALLFGLGIGAIMALMAITMGLSIPGISTRLDNAAYRMRTYYRKVIPHPEYLPTPIPAASAPTALQRAPEHIEPRVLHPVEQQPTPTPTPTSEENIAQPPPPTATAPAATATLTPTIEPVATVAPVLDRVQLKGFSHQWQTWNNCGPATITMGMSYFGRPETQVNAAKFLKPNRDDKNVSPHEMAAYVRSASNLEALVRQGGSLETLKLLLANDLPVITETWLVHDGDGLGHYRLMTGYDDAAGQFTTLDSLNGPNYHVSYEQFDADWRVFNRLYIVIYSPEQTGVVQTIIGEDMSDTFMYGKIVASAEVQIGLDPDDAIAYFNQGDALTHLGRYEEAAAAFDQARKLGLHWRRLWYQFTPFEAYYAVSRYQDVLDLTKATIKGAGGLEEAYYYHGLALHATGQPGAEDDFQAALEYNPNFTPALEALNQLVSP